MDKKQTPNGNARILIGREDGAGSSLSDVFTLSIDSKMIYSLKADERDSNDYISNCRDAAGEIAREMIKRRLEGYCIDNGKRQHLKDIIPCKAIPPDGINVFRSTLDAKLSYVKVVV